MTKISYLGILLLVLVALLPFAFSQPPSKPARGGEELQQEISIPEKYMQLIKENEKYFETVKEGKDYVPGERIVVFLETVSKDEALQVLREAGAKEAIPLAPGKARRLMHLVKFENEEAAQAAEKQLKKNPKVALVAKNKLLRIPPVIKEQISLTPSAASKDPFRPYQWWLDKIKDNIAPPPTGGTGRLIAVLDTGVDYNHEDLQGQVVLGYDWVNNDTDPYDDYGHGTHVAGIIAAKRDNLKGISGLAPNYKVYAVKVCDASGSCPLDAIINGIYEAAENPDVDVISMSLGGYAQRGSGEFVLLCDAASYAIQQGKAVVAAAGNEGNLDLYWGDLYNGVVGDYEWTVVPAGCPGVIGVAATDEHDYRAFFSNYAVGNLYDLTEFAAPGWAVLSTVPGNGYEAWYGTSMATPIVSAAIARVKAYWNYPDVWSAVARLMGTGYKLNSFRGFPVPTARVDIARALGYTGSGIQGYVFSAEGYEGPLGGAKITIVSGPTGTVGRYVFTNNAGFYTFSGLPAGTYTLKVTKEGYISYTLKVTVPAGGFAENVNFYLVKAAYKDVAKVVVTWDSVNPGLYELFAQWLDHPDRPMWYQAAGSMPALLVRVLPDNFIASQRTLPGELNYWPYVRLLRDAWDFKPVTSAAFKVIRGRTVDVAVAISSHFGEWGILKNRRFTVMLYVGDRLQQVVELGIGTTGTADFWWTVLSFTTSARIVNKREPLQNFIHPGILDSPPYVKTSGASIILVDYDASRYSGDWRDYSKWYKDLLGSGKYKYSYWDAAWLGPPSVDDLKSYNVVVVFSGSSSAFLDRYTRNAFASYMSLKGKRALVTGQDEGWALHELLWPPADLWYQTNLKAVYVSDYWPYFIDPSTRLVALQGASGDLIGDGLTVFLSNSSLYGGAGNQWWPDVILPYGNSTPILYYMYPDGAISGYAGGIRWSDAEGRKLVYFSFGVEGVTDDEVRATLMDRALKWLLAP